MMQDANSSLQQAIKAKDMNKVEVAQALLEAAQKILKVDKSQAHQRKDLVHRILAKARISRQNAQNVAETRSIKVKHLKKHAAQKLEIFLTHS